MPRVKSPARVEAERLCRAMPDSASRTLAKKISAKYKMTLEKARSMIRTIRGVRGVEQRKTAADKSLYREPRKAGEVPAMPPSLAEPWTPFDLGNGHRTAILSDIHLPYHSSIALDAAVKYFKKLKPDNILINGDLMDYYSISRYQKDPSKIDFNAELEAGSKFLEWIRHEFHKCRIIYKDGNHDERFALWVFQNAPLLEKLPKEMRTSTQDFLVNLIDEVLDCKKHGIERVKDHRPVMLGHLPVFHGHESGKTGLASSVNAARGLFLKTLSTMLVGHSHRTSQHAEADWRHKQTSTWSTGCLCELNPAYWRMANRWNWGAAFVEVDSKGEFNVENFRIGPAGEIWT